MPIHACRPTKRLVIHVIGAILACGIFIPPVYAQLPTNWTATAVGGDSGTGTTYAADSGTFTINAKDGNIGQTGDAFQWVGKPITGNFEMVARLVSCEKMHSDGVNKMGIILRETTGEGAAVCRFVFLPFVTLKGDSSSTLRSEARQSTGMPTGAGAAAWVPSVTRTPIWMKMVRYRRQVACYYSFDAQTWFSLQPGNTTDFPPDSGTNAVGLAVVAGTSRGTTNNVTAVFDNVVVTLLPVDAPLPYITSWFGNDLAGGSKWVQNFCDGMWVTPDGTVYVPSGSDEGGQNVGIYKDGTRRTDAPYTGNLADLTRNGRVAGSAVTSDGQFVYLAMTQTTGGRSGAAETSYCVRRYDLFGNTKPWTTGGQGPDSSMLIVQSSGPYDKKMPQYQIKGVGAFGTAGSPGAKLYVSDAHAGQVKIFDLSNASTISPKPSATIDVPGCGPLVVAKDGSIWVVSQDDVSHVPVVTHYSETGAELITITGLSHPTAIAINPSNGQLLIADAGTSEQVKMFDITGIPKQVDSLGVAGGLYAPATPGAITDATYDQINGVGADIQGDFYVSSNWGGQCVVYAYTPGKKTLWRLRGLEYESVSGFDASSDGEEIFTKTNHYHMDYSKTNGGEWSWVGHTVDRRGTYDDARNHPETGANYMAKTFIRTVDGKRIMFVGDQGYFAVYRFLPKSDIAVPCALFIAAKATDGWPMPQSVTPTGRFIWNDRNGDGRMDLSPTSEEFTSEPESFMNGGGIYGWYVDANADIWTADPRTGIRRYLCQGLDSHGSVRYLPDKAHSQAWPIPPEFEGGGVNRAVYIPASDTLIVTGFTSAHPAAFNSRGQAGSEMVCYANWLSKEKPKTKLWQIVLPYFREDGSGRNPSSIDVAAGRVFLGYYETCEMIVFSLADGASIGRILPGPEIAGTQGGYDRPFSFSTYVRSNGELLISAEGQLQNKQVLYRQSPPPVPTHVTACVEQSLADDRHRVRVDWVAADPVYGRGVMRYNIYRSMTADGPHLKIGSTTGVSFIDVDITNNSNYYYAVSAANAAAESEHSADAIVVASPAKVAAQVARPNRPSGVTLAGELAGPGPQVLIAWHGMGELGTVYTVKRASSVGGPYSILQQNLTLGGTADTSVDVGTTYYYVVSATNAAGESEDSEPSGPITPLIAPLPPQQLSAVPEPPAIHLSWNAVLDSKSTSAAETYLIYRSTVAGRGLTLIGTSSTNGFIDKSIIPGTKYFYAVSASHSIWGGGAKSKQTSATAP